MIENIAEMGKTLSDMVLDFFESENQTHTQQHEFTYEGEGGGGGGEEEDPDHVHAQEENNAFWESQYQLLQEALSRSSPSETRIQADTADAIAKARSATKERTHSSLLQNVANLLQNSGHNSAVCKSKWGRAPDIPPGEHSYIDVITEVNNAKKRPNHIVIELNFRAEFEMARASAVYNGLVERLPEVFVGKRERLRRVIRIMCDAIKRCMKENKMHMPPWRKQKYMESKWLGNYERVVVVVPSMWVEPARVLEGRVARPRASMLTFDLHCTATVEVV